MMAKSDAEHKKMMEEKHQAMMKRLESLPDDNAIIEAALKEEEDDTNKDKRYQEWETCQELVSAATGKYIDGDMTLKKALKSLGEALIALSDKS